MELVRIVETKEETSVIDLLSWVIERTHRYIENRDSLNARQNHIIKMRLWNKYMTNHKDDVYSNEIREVRIRYRTVFNEGL